MKRFTLSLMALMIAVMGFAQPGKSSHTLKTLPVEMQKIEKAVKPSTMRRLAPRKATDVVTLPSEATPESFQMSAYELSAAGASPVTKSVQVAFVGNDVYVQGFSKYVPDAWVKGTLDAEGTTVTFPSGQYYGELVDGLDTYNFYFVGAYDVPVEGQEDKYEWEICDVVFAWDAENQTMTLDQEIYVLETGAADETSAYTGFIYAVLEKVEDTVATPADADPEDLAFDPFDDSEGYGGFYFIYDPVDTEGNPLVVDNLYYTIWADDGTGEKQLTFVPGQYNEKLTEEMTEIPWNFTDNWDFDVQQGWKCVFLNNPIIKTYKRIGIQFIYYGGGECNKSNVVWYEIPEEEEPVETDWDWVAAEEGYEDQEKPEDGSTIEVGEYVTGTISTGGNTQVPQYYANGEALRMYPKNSITLTSNDGETPITNVTIQMFVASGKGDKLEANVGTMVYDEENTTYYWTGSETEIVFTVPEGSGNQARIVAIAVTLEGEGGDEPFVEPDLVEVPENLETEDYVLFGHDVYYDTDTQLPVTVGFDGNDVYICGLSEYAYGWVKGTKQSDGSYVVPAGQYMGLYYGDYMGYTLIYAIYFGGATFTFDPAAKSFTSEEGYTTYGDFVGLGGDEEEDYYAKSRADEEEEEAELMDEIADVEILKVVEGIATPADPSLYGVSSDEDYTWVDFFIPLQDTEGHALNADNMEYRLYTDVGGEISVLKATTDLYTELVDDMDIFPWGFSDDWDIYVYATGHSFYINDMDAYATWDRIGVQSVYSVGADSKESEIVWYLINSEYDPEYDAIKNVDAEKNATVRYYDLAGRKLNNAVRGIVIRNGKKVLVK